MNVLAIGNSFSQDATRYLHRIARADGVGLNVTNLYIGGCPLEQHFRNMHADERAYMLEYNGEQTRFAVSLKEALLNRSWDVVTLQQASPVSFEKETYFPYLTILTDYVKELCPKAKILLHQTWGYETGSAKAERTPFSCYEQMQEAVIKAYAEAAEEIDCAGIIPCGELLKKLTENGVEKIHRDGYHLQKGIGRYATALLWYRMLTGKTVAENTFCDWDEAVEEKDMLLAKRLVDEFSPIF